MKDTETKKAVSMTTTIAMAILATALVFPTMTTVAVAQSSSNDFQEFMECLFSDVGGSTATAQDIEDVLQGNPDDVTEQEIRDCFSPIYNDASSDDNTGSSSSNDDDSTGTSDSNNNSDDEEDSTEETDSTENTDSTEGDDTTEGTDDTDTNDDNEDTTTGDPDSTNDSTDSSPQ
jgi:hypothetical protein